MDPQTSKPQLRSRIRSARFNRTPAEAAANSRTLMPARTSTGSRMSAGSRTSADSRTSVSEVAWNLIESEFATAHTMLAYASLAGEPDFDPAIDAFLAAGGTVFLPVVTEVGRPLMFGRVTGSMASLQPQGKWGIREPLAAGSGLLTPEQLLSPEVGLDLVFIPALGFSAEGARLGNGGGFYDRTFGPHGTAPLQTVESSAGPVAKDGDLRLPQVFGVCFDSELDLPGLVAADWDLHIPAAVTECGVRTF